MTKLGITALALAMPAVSIAHEGHHLEGLLGHTLHGFSGIEMGLGLSAAIIYTASRQRSGQMRKGGLIVATLLAALGLAV